VVTRTKKADPIEAGTGRPRRFYARARDSAGEAAWGNAPHQGRRTAASASRPVSYARAFVHARGCRLRAELRQREVRLRSSA
jgi:hypothetical protein